MVDFGMDLGGLNVITRTMSISNITGIYKVGFHSEYGRVNHVDIQNKLHTRKNLVEHKQVSNFVSQHKKHLWEDISRLQMVLLDCRIAEFVLNYQKEFIVSEFDPQSIKRLTYTDVFNGVDMMSLSTVTRYLRDDRIKVRLNKKTIVLNDLVSQSSKSERLEVAMKALRHLSSSEGIHISRISTARTMKQLEDWGQCSWSHRAMHPQVLEAKKLLNSNRDLETLIAALS